MRSRWQTPSLLVGVSADMCCLRGLPARRPYAHALAGMRAADRRRRPFAAVGVARTLRRAALSLHARHCRVLTDREARGLADLSRSILSIGDGSGLVPWAQSVERS